MKILIGTKIHVDKVSQKGSAAQYLLKYSGTFGIFDAVKLVQKLVFRYYPKGKKNNKEPTQKICITIVPTMLNWISTVHQFSVDRGSRLSIT